MSPTTPYSVTETQKQQFAGIYVLEYMINAPKQFALLLEDEEQDLEPILEWLLVRELVEIKHESYYAPTEKGRSALERFMQRYSDFLSFFDVFCAVDLAEGAFAFSSYFDFDDKDDWLSFIQQERWEDLRVAVAAYKQIDPVEIVFMSFLNEGRFGRATTGWEFDLLLGSVWDDILEICNTALTMEQLGWESEEGYVSGETVLRDVVTQGLMLIEELHGREEDPYRAIEHPTTDGPSTATVEAVKTISKKANQFDPTPTPPDNWKEPWEL